jgi:transposase-like protein
MTGKKLGAPKGSGSKYTEEIADRICQALSEGTTLSEVCREIGIDRTIVYDWMKERDILAQRIARARELGEDAIADEALQIANTPTTGTTRVYKNGELAEVREEDMIAHRKLQIETRLKLLAKWNPKKWGERITHAGDANAPVALVLEGSDKHG